MGGRNSREEGKSLPDRTCMGNGGADAWPDVVVVALVLVLFLAPHQIGVWIFINLCFHQVKWEWRELQPSIRVS